MFMPHALHMASSEGSPESPPPEGPPAVYSIHARKSVTLQQREREREREREQEQEQEREREREREQ